MDTSKIEENTYLKTEPTADTSYHSISQLRSRVQNAHAKVCSFRKTQKKLSKTNEELPTGVKPGSLKVNHIQKSIHTLKQKEIEIAGGKSDNLN